jgi:hypothetical protein
MKAPAAGINNLIMNDNYIIIESKIQDSSMRDKSGIRRKSQAPAKNPRRTGGRRQESAYGDEASICLNAECIMRKRAKCLGFEGCPGFKGR